MIDTKQAAAPATLAALAKARRWDELDKAWQPAIESDSPPTADLLAALEAAIKENKNEWAEASAWAWLVETKEHGTPAEALALARELLVRLPSGAELRAEVLELYRKTHTDTPHLDEWITRSGLSGQASVRKALRYLDVALQLKVGAYLLNRSDESAAEITGFHVATDEVELKTARAARTQTIAQVIDEYQVADADDFRVLRQLRPDRLAELVRDDPLALVIGVLKANRGRIDRDELKNMLVSRYVEAGQWNDWWTRVRNGIKKSAHVTMEGRSPVFLYYHEAGKSLEEETQENFIKAQNARELLSCVEGYLRESRSRKQSPDTAFLARLGKQLMDLVKKQERFEVERAFATALVIERLHEEGLPLADDVHRHAVAVMAAAKHPDRLLLSTPELALWSMATACVKQALPERWPDVFATAMPQAPASQCDGLAKDIEKAGRGAELLPGVVTRVLDDPSKHVEALMWLWKGPDLKTPLDVPPLMDLWNIIIKLVGPARDATRGPSSVVNALRASVRSGLSSRGYARFRTMIEGREEAMGAALRRQVDRAEGLGPVVQDELQTIIREVFPRLFAKAKIEPWDDPNVLWVTEAGRAKKEAEINELVNVKMRENAIAIGRAAEHGDLSENSEYKFALEERDLLRARLAQMNMEMSLARVLEPKDVPTENVGIGHRILLRSPDGTAERTVTLLGPWESDLSKGIFAYQAPIALRLLGKKPGELVSFPANDAGDEREFRIESFQSAI